MIQKLHWWVSKENKNSNSKRYIQPCAHCHIIYNNQDIKTTQVPIDRWVDKDSVIHTRTDVQTHTHTMEYYSAIQKEGNLANMDGPWKQDAKRNKLKKDKCLMTSLICEM